MTAHSSFLSQSFTCSHPNSRSSADCLQACYSSRPLITKDASQAQVQVATAPPSRRDQRRNHQNRSIFDFRRANRVTRFQKKTQSAVDCHIQTIVNRDTPAPIRHLHLLVRLALRMGDVQAQHDRGTASDCHCYSPRVRLLRIGDVLVLTF
jgi:hypothetical protein